MITVVFDVGDFSLRGMHDSLACERCHKDNEKLSLVPIEGRTNWPGASY